MNVRRGLLYFVVALVLEGVLLVFSGVSGLAMIFLFPGMIVSAVISHGSDTGNVSFIIGLALDAGLYAFLGLLVERAVKRRRPR
jgi:hypothetical protein